MDEKIESMKELGPKTFKNIEEVRVFILISTVMTWALTKPIDPVRRSIILSSTSLKVSFRKIQLFLSQNPITKKEKPIQTTKTTSIVKRKLL